MRIADPIKSVKHSFLGVTLEISRAHSPAHLARTVEITNEIKDAKGYASYDDLLAADVRMVNARSMPGIVLVGWEDFNDGDGEPIEFTDENAVALLLDDDYAYEFVLKHALNQDQFLRRASGETKKKSLPGSSGKLSMAAS